MKKNRWRAAFLCGAIALLCAHEAQAEKTAKEVVEASIRAAGGYEALTRIYSIHRTGTLNITVGQTGFNGTAELSIIPWQTARLVMDVGLEKRIQGWNGTTAWEAAPQRVRELKTDEAGAIRLQSIPYPLIGYQMLAILGSPLRLEPAENIDDQTHDTLAVDLGENIVLRFYVPEDTKLVRRLRISAGTPQGGVTVHIDVDYFGYESFGEVKLPTRTVISVGNLFTLETDFDKTELNQQLDESIFEKPSSAGQ